MSFAALNVMAQTADQSATNKHLVCKKDPNMPKGAVPVWPKSDYTQLQDPSCPPCYKYKSKKTGLMIMECPYLWFPAEHKDPATGEVTQTAMNGSVTVQRNNSYTGNYPICPKDPLMPANAKPVFPKSEYTPLGHPECAPCYEYTTKRGTKVMECHQLWFPAEHKDQ